MVAVRSLTLQTPSRRKAGRLAGALDGFLGTLTSRNADFRGYWVWGLVESRLDGLDIDLLAAQPHADDAFGAAARMAGDRFRDQIPKAGLDPERVSQARLQVTFEGGVVTKRFNRSTFEGHTARFVASASLNTGEVMTRETSVFVAPHSWRREMRSSR